MVQSYEQLRAKPSATGRPRSYDDVRQASFQVKAYRDKIRNDQYSAIFADGRVDSYLAGDTPNNMQDQLISEERVRNVVGVIEMNPNPNQFRAKLANSLDLADVYGWDVETALMNHDSITKGLWGEDITAEAAFQRITGAKKEGKDLERILKQESFWESATRHTGRALRRAQLSLVKSVAGYAQMSGYLNQKLTPFEVDAYDETKKWGEEMSAGVEEYYRQNPQLLIRDVGDGFIDTTKKYLSNPWLIYEGVVETVPMVLEAALGHITGTAYARYLGAGARAIPWISRVQAIAVPLITQKYAELRDEGIKEGAALAHSILSGQGEALLEEWTFRSKLNIFKGTGNFVKQNMASQASKVMLGGAKAYARGTTEEGSQAIWSNFLRKIFVDPDQSIMDGVFQQAAVGGLIETTMGGGFAVAGKVRYGYNINKGASDIVKNSTLTKQQAKEALDEVYQDIYDNLQNTKLTDEQRTGLFNNKLAEKIDLKQRTNVIIKQTELKEQIATPEGQVQRLEQIREQTKSGNLSEEDSAEVDNLIDETIAKIEAGEDVIAPQVVEEPTPELIETAPPTITEEINQTPQFGMAQTISGDWIVVDYETQKEVGNSGGGRFIANQMNRYNSGDLVPKPERRAPLLPAEEKVTMNVRQMLNLVMAKVSAASAKGYLQGARDIVAIHRNLAKFANSLLSKVDTTKAQRKTLLSAVSNSRSPAQQVAAMATIQRLADVALHADAVRSLKKTMAFVNSKTSKSMQEGGIRPEYLIRIQEMSNAISLKGKVATSKFNKAVASLKKHVDNMREGMAGQYDRPYAEELLPPRLLERIGEIPVKSVQNMTAEEVLELDNALKELLHLNKTKNRIILDRTARDAASVLNQSLAEMDNVKSVAELKSDARTPQHRRGAVRTLLNWTAGRENHDIETLVDTISGGQAGTMFEVIPESLSYGRGVQAEYILAANDHLKSVMAANGITMADLQQMSPAFFRLLKTEKGLATRGILSNFGFETVATPVHTIKIGKTNVDFSLAELMSFYMHGQAGFNIKEIIKSGIAVRAGNTMNKVKGVTVDTFRRIAEIVEADPKAVALIEAAAFIHENIAKPAINKVSVDLKGIELAQVENYFHIERWSTGGVAGTEAYRISLLESEGRLQERTGGKNPIKVLDFFEVILNDIQSISEYVGMAKPYRSIKMLLNYKPLRDAIIEKGYGPNLNNLDTLMAFTEENISSSTKIDSLFGAILRGTTRSVLAMPHIMVGQYVSTGGYFLEADRKYASALRIAATQKTEQRYLDNWAFFRLRREGGLTSRAMGEIVQSDKALRALTGKKDAVNYFLSGINHVDSRAIIEAGRITEAEMADKDRKGKSQEYWSRQGIEPSDIEFESEDYWDAFRKRATFLVRRTQPMFSPEHRSVLTAGKDPTKRMFTMFRSYVDQPLRIMARVMTAYRNGAISWSAMATQLGAAMSLFIFHSIITNIIKQIMFNEDRDLKSYVLDAFTSPLGALTFIGFPLEAMIQRAVETAWGERPGVWKPRFDTVATSWINSIIDASNDLALAIAFSGSGEKFKSGPDRGKLKSTVHLKRALFAGTEEGLRFVGVPAQIPRKVYEGWTRENKGKFKLPEID